MKNAFRLSLVYSLLMVGSAFANFCLKHPEDNVVELSQQEVCPNDAQSFEFWNESPMGGLIARLSEIELEVPVGDTFVLRLTSNIDFGGTVEVNETVSCQRDDFYPLNFSNVLLDGNNKEIQGLCYISWSGGAVGFFSSINNGVVRDITFRDSYLKTGEFWGEITFDVGVVAGHAYQTQFENVKVLNSSLYGIKGGSFVGSINEGSMENCEASGNTITADSSVVGVGSNWQWAPVQLGGLASDAYGDVSFDRVKVSDVFVENKIDGVSTRLGGAFGYLGGASVNRMAITNASLKNSGNNSDSRTFSANELDEIGFIAGYALIESYQGITNTYSIDGEIVSATGNNALTGYVAASLIYKDGTVGGNYHYGSDNIAKFAGQVLDNSNDLIDESSVDGYDYNFRNATATLTAGETILPASEMKTAKMAWKLGHYRDYLETKWSFDKSQNGSLPFFADEEYKPIYRIAFLRWTVENVISAKEKEALTPYKEDYLFAGYTDREGTLDPSFVSAIKGIKNNEIVFDNKKEDFPAETYDVSRIGDLSIVKKVAIHYADDSDANLDNNENVLFVWNRLDSMSTSVDSMNVIPFIGIKKGGDITWMKPVYYVLSNAQGEKDVMMQLSSEYRLDDNLKKDVLSRNAESVTLIYGPADKNSFEATYTLKQVKFPDQRYARTIPVKLTDGVTDYSVTLTDQAEYDGDKFMRQSLLFSRKLIVSQEDTPGYVLDSVDLELEIEAMDGAPESTPSSSSMAQTVTVRMGKDGSGSVDMNFVYEWLAQQWSGWSNSISRGYSSITANVIPHAHPITYTVSYDANVSDKSELFYGVNWVSEVEYVYDSESANLNLPSAYRKGYCFGGLSPYAVPTPNMPVYRGGTGLGSGVISNLIKLNPDTTHFTLYAVWNKNDEQGMPCTQTDEVILETDGHGVIRLAQPDYGKSGRDTIYHAFEAVAGEKNQYKIEIPHFRYSDGAMAFYAIPRPDSGYVLYHDSVFIEELNGPVFTKDVTPEDTVRVMGAKTIYRASFIKEGPYDVDFELAKMDVGDVSSLFFASPRKTYEFDHVQSLYMNELLPVFAGSEGMYFFGWTSSEPDIGTPGYRVYNGDLYDEMERLKSKKLYASWSLKGDEENRIALQGEISDFGSVTLTQFINKEKVVHKLKQEAYKLPYRSTELGYTFILDVEVSEGFALDGKIMLIEPRMVQNFDGVNCGVAKKFDEFDTTYYNPGDTVTITPKCVSMDSYGWPAVFDYPVTIVGSFAEIVELAVDLNTKRTEVFFGDSSSAVSHMEYLAGESIVDLPRWIYSSDACVVSWKPSADKDVEEDFGYSLEGFYIRSVLSDFAGEGFPTIYATWGDSKQCVEKGGYQKIKVVSENGSVNIKEVSSFGENKGEVHALAADSSFLIPGKMSGLVAVEAKPDKDCVLDSIVLVSNDGKNRVKLADGDGLDGIAFSGVLTAFFSDTSIVPSPFKIAQAELISSGNAINLNVKTNEFSSRGKVQLMVLLQDAKNGKTIADSVLLSDVKKSPAEASWTYYPLAAGDYLLKTILTDGKDSVVEKKNFSVAAEIAAAPRGGWQMLSIVAVNKDSVDWNDDDAAFYWWDESSLSGEYWQYKIFGKKDEAKVTQGAWYSSLEGRPLSIKAPVLDAAVEWKVDSVYSGWNLMANPYSWGIAVPDSLVEVWKWDPSIVNYREAEYIGPYEAVWVRTGKSRTVSLNNTPVFVADSTTDSLTTGHASKRRALAKASNSRDWTIRAILEDGRGHQDSWNVLGVGKSLLMEEPPRGMGDGVNLSIEEDRRLLAKSVKAYSSDEMEWTLNLSATSNRKGYLSFEGFEQVAAYGYRLFVTIDGKTTEVMAGEKLPVALKATDCKAIVRVAKSAPEVAFGLKNLKVVHSGNQLNFNFEASADLMDREFVVELMDLSGKVLASHRQGAAALNSAVLEAPKPGMYFARVRLGGKVLSNRFVVK